MHTIFVWGLGDLVELATSCNWVYYGVRNIERKDLTKTSLKEVRVELETQMGLDAKGLDPF